MNLRELTWPVRIYWDLPADPSETERCLNICDEIIERKVLFLSLCDTGPSVSQLCLSVLNRLKGANIGISLTVPAAALIPLVLTQLSAAGVRTLLIEALSYDEVCSVAEKGAGYRMEGLPIGISFGAGRNNYREIPEVVSCCLTNRIRDLVFPIQRLVNAKECFFVDSVESEKLAGRLKSIEHKPLRITIHDPFLWKVFYPDADYHEGGCQAANSMLYISPEQKVYPCPAMPLELGDLHEVTLREIILSPAKKDLRRTLLSPPAECGSCGLASKCLGGCRGRAVAVSGSFDRRDPGCTVCT